MEILQEEIKRFFHEKPDSLPLFRAVRKTIESIGPSSLTVTKSQLSFGTKRKFAWVWFAPKWAKNVPARAIVLSFCLDHALEDTRIRKVSEPYPGRFMHHMLVQSPQELSGDVLTWLEYAYTFSQHTKQRR